MRRSIALLTTTLAAGLLTAGCDRKDREIGPTTDRTVEVDRSEFQEEKRAYLDGAKARVAELEERIGDIEKELVDKRREIQEETTQPARAPVSGDDSDSLDEDWERIQGELNQARETMQQELRLVERSSVEQWGAFKDSASRQLDGVDERLDRIEDEVEAKASAALERAEDANEAAEEQADELEDETGVEDPMPGMERPTPNPLEPGDRPITPRAPY